MCIQYYIAWLLIAKFSQPRLPTGGQLYLPRLPDQVFQEGQMTIQLHRPDIYARPDESAPAPKLVDVK